MNLKGTYPCTIHAQEPKWKPLKLKHENKELSLSETRLRTQMFQLQKINDLLQQQNEELTPKDKKKKMKDKKESPKLFMPPPMYKELEKQVEVLRSVF